MWQADGLQANIVTFNTLIDAMGKAGRWQDAIGVLDIIDQQVSCKACKHAFGPCLTGFGFSATVKGSVLITQGAEHYRRADVYLPLWC